MAYAFSTIFLSLKFDRSGPNDQRDFLRVLQTWHSVFPHSVIKDIEAKIFGNTNSIAATTIPCLHSPSIGRDRGKPQQNGAWMQHSQQVNLGNHIPPYHSQGAYPLQFPASLYQQHQFARTPYPMGHFLGQMPSSSQHNLVPPHFRSGAQMMHSIPAFNQVHQTAAPVSPPDFNSNESVTFPSGNPLELLEELKEFLQTSSSDQPGSTGGRIGNFIEDFFFYRSPPMKVELSFSGIQK